MHCCLEFKMTSWSSWKVFLWLKKLDILVIVTHRFLPWLFIGIDHSHADVNLPSEITAVLNRAPYQCTNIRVYIFKPKKGYAIFCVISLPLDKLSVHCVWKDLWTRTIQLASFPPTSHPNGSRITLSSPSVCTLAHKEYSFRFKRLQQSINSFCSLIMRPSRSRQ